MPTGSVLSMAIQCMRRENSLSLVSLSWITSFAPLLMHTCTHAHSILRNSEERIACEKRLKRQENALEGHRTWRRNMGIEFTKGEIDKATETATWFEH